MAIGIPLAIGDRISAVAGRRKIIGFVTGIVDTDTFNLTLHTSAAALTAASLAALTSFGSVGSEVTSTSGYSTSGTALQSITWQSGASAGEQRFD